MPPNRKVDSAPMKRVLFFDSWSKGSTFTDPVAKTLGREVELYYLHANSLFGLQSDPDFDTTLYQERELQGYGYSILEAIRDIDPDVVVFISVHGLIHRWANFVCQSLNINSLFFMHGVRGSVPSEPALSYLVKNFVKKIGRAALYTRQYMYFVSDFRSTQKSNLPVKVGSLIDLFRDWAEMIFNNLKHRDNPANKSLFAYHTICVNDETDFEYFSSCYGIVDTKMVVSGNVLARDIAIEAREVSVDRDRIVYYSQPLISAKLISREQALSVIANIADKVMAITGKMMVVRLHPRDDFNRREIEDIYSVEVSSESSVFDVARTRLAIGHFSAILLSCKDLEIPIISLVLDTFPNVPSIQNSSRSQVISIENEDWISILSQVLKTVPKESKAPLPALLSSAEIVANEIRELW